MSTETHLIFLDTETTGLNIDTCEVWEIGLIARRPIGDEPGFADFEYQWQLRPDLSGAEPTGLRIGRYYQRNVAADGDCGIAYVIEHPDMADLSEHGGPAVTTAEGLASDLAGLLDGATIIGAVPWFDERFLAKFLRQHGQCLTAHYHLADVETLAAGALRIPPPWNFDKLLSAYGLAYDENDRHTALGDARMVRDLYDAAASTTMTVGLVSGGASRSRRPDSARAAAFEEAVEFLLEHGKKPGGECYTRAADLLSRIGDLRGPADGAKRDGGAGG